MSGDISDTYAVVGKSKKTNRKNNTSRPTLSPDPLADLYSVVDKSHKSKPDPTTLTEDTYEAIPTENFYYANTDKSATHCNSASAHTLYSTFEQTQVHSAVVDNTLPQAPDLPAKQEKYNKEQENEKRNKNPHVWMPVCFTVLIIAVIAAAVAVAMAFVLIVGLRSDLTAALKDSSSSSGSTTENKNATNSLEPQINELRIGFNNYSATVNNQLYFLNQNTSGGVENLNLQHNSTLELLRQLNGKVNLLASSVNSLEGNFSEQLNDISNNTIKTVQNLNIDIIEEIMNASNISLATINTLTDRLASGIQDLHTFDSCAAVSAFPIQLPSGMYNIRSDDSVTQQYCLLSCNGVNGAWKRIAYLNTDENPVTCPDGFEVRSDTSNPPLCRHNSDNAGCFPVTYPSNGTSYSHVCGTVRIHQQETPDGFQSHDINIPRNNQSVNQNYVDGVSLTHGTSPNRTHIWTYTAVIKFGDDIDRCTICDRNKPFYIGTNFTCTAGHCNEWPCELNDAIWTDGLSCFGNETFYRQLSESTTDNIEMRVCKDQGRNDEDILISYIEIFVL